MFVSEVRIHTQGLGGGDLVIHGELGRRWACGVHEAGGEQDVAPDTLGEILDVDVAETLEYLRFALVERIEHPEIGFEFRIGVLCQVHLPDPAVIGEEWIHGSQRAYSRFERGAGEGQCAPLAASRRSDTIRVDAGQGHHDTGELHGIEEDRAVE